MNNQNIPGLLPQKYPFIFVDGILDEKSKPPQITCYKNITINEPFFAGHFPGKPILPGVLIIEALAQASIILLHKIKKIPDKEKDKYSYYLGKTEARFFKPVKPGDKLILEVKLEKYLAQKAIIKGTARVKKETVALASIILALSLKN